MQEVLRDRLRDDLKGAIEGDLLLDELSLNLYSTDASPFEVRPLAVLRPRHEADLRIALQYAAEANLSVTARGAGTGSAGGALGPGLILDFSRYFRSILEISSTSCRVQAGVTLERVAQRLALDGLQPAIESPGSMQATIGGIVARDAIGPNHPLLGYPRDQLISCRAILDNGDPIELATVPREAEPEGSERWSAIHRATVRLLERSTQLINGERPITPYYRGFRLDGVLTEDAIHYHRLLAGSEGGLALLTELTLKVLPLPRGRAALLLGYDDPSAALTAWKRIEPAHPVRVQLLDGRLVSVLRPKLANLIPPALGAALFMELSADSGEAASRLASTILDEQTHADGLARWALPALSSAEAQRLASIVQSAFPGLAESRGGAPPTTVLDDISVPPERLPEFLQQFQDILKRHESTAGILAHPATGLIEARPFLNPAQAEDAAKLWAIAESTYDLSIGLGGSISAREGFGLARTPWVAKQYPKLAPIYRELKNIFDRRLLLNPGNIVGPDPSRPAWPFRQPVELPTVAEEPPASPAAPVERPRTGRQLLWSANEFDRELQACQGCGDCRSESASLRMCPVFRASPAEESSPRAKVNLLRSVLQASADGKRLAAEDVRNVADLCVNCKMCARECASRINVPKLMLEAKAANVAEHGLDRPDWVIAHIHGFSWLGSMFSLVANRLMRGPITRWVMEKFFGISRQRRMPPFAGRNFLRLARREGWTEPIPDLPKGSVKAALFVDIFANYHDPQTAEAAVRVLRHNGVFVTVPRKQQSCGMEALAQGDIERAQEVARYNLKTFAALVRQGHRIVCIEPTAALALRLDYLDLIDDPDAKLVAEATIEFSEFLRELHQQGRLKTAFQPLELHIGHHVPCHVKALTAQPAGPDLLRLIPKMRVHTIDVGCSGMAGTYGLRASGFETSMAAGQAMFDELRRPRVMFGSTECSACRMQMEQGSGKRTLHPAQYLALAYGLMPELEKRFSRPFEGLVAE